MKPARLSEGKRIEDVSFDFIESKLALPYPEREVAKRVVHATADFSFADALVFHGDAVNAGVSAIRKGVDVVTDVRMVAVGVNSEGLMRFGGMVKCFIDDANTRALASETGMTRSRAAFRTHAKEIHGNIAAVGNAPTALMELCRLVGEGIRPALVVASPVGFVGAKDAKKRILEYDIPSIAIRGERGGSPVAASVVNALISLAE